MKLNILLRYAFKAFVVVLLLSSCRDEVIDLPCEKKDAPIRPKTLLEEAQEYSEKTIIGTLHSHYPLTWAATGIFRDVAQSEIDENSDLPGVVYDYKNRVYAGDPVDMKNNPKDYYNYGLKRRVTPEI